MAPLPARAWVLRGAPAGPASVPLSGSGTISARVIETFADFRSLEAAWNDLLARSGRDNVFLTWEWCHAWARHYVPDGDLRLIVDVGDDGAPWGIAPLYLARTRRRRSAPVRELRFLGAGEACAAYLDLIVPAGEREEFTARVYETLYGPLRGWDVLTLEDVAADSPLVDDWSTRVEDAGKALDLAGQSVCAVIDLPASVEAFHAGLSRNARANLKRKRRWLEEAGQVTFHHGGFGGEDPHGLVALEALHQERWRAREGPGAFASDRFRAFHREVAEAFAGRGWLDVDFLLLDGEPIAGVYGFTHGGCYHYYLPGLEPTRTSRASPGMQLLVHRIERAIAAGCRRVDLLRGMAPYKATVANGLRRCISLRSYRRGLRALLFKGIEDAKDLGKIAFR